MFLIETALTVFLLVMAFSRPATASHFFTRVEHAFALLSRRRGLSVAIVGISAVVVRVALLPAVPVPRPHINDEFGYLLISDTFAHGRVTNPTPTMWPHFETFHVNLKPTYTAMFYPGQGLFLATGQVLLGHPFWGVLLSVALMCAAICWMFQGWLPPPWALLGGFIFVMKIGIFSYWVNSYWGGAVSALGGALVMGALPRIRRRQKTLDALWMGLGLATLANTRPFEAIFFCSPVLLIILSGAIGREKTRISVRRTVLPLGLVVCLALTAMGYYFWRTTGSPFRTPYLVNKQTYSLVYFPWETLNHQASFHYQEMREFHLRVVARTYDNSRSLVGFAGSTLATLVRLWLFFVGPILSIPAVFLMFVLPYGFRYREISRNAKFLLLILFVSVLGLLLPIFFHEHYAAPLTCVIYALILMAMQRMRRWRRSTGTGLALVRAVVVLSIAVFLLNLLSLMKPGVRPSGFGDARASIESQLMASAGDHLLIVHYGPQHDPLHEWIFNGADIDSQRVIWARDMGRQNDELLRYYAKRRVWLLEADDIPPKLMAYTDSSSAAVSTSVRGNQ